MSKLKPIASDLAAIENRLWAAADQLWANTGLKPAEFSTPERDGRVCRCTWRAVGGHCLGRVALSASG